jgi:hypothetical protein
MLSSYEAAMKKEFIFSIVVHKDSNWQIRKLGKGRISFDLGRISFKFEYYEFK